MTHETPSPTAAALGRAGRRVIYHMIQAAIEGLKAVEAVIEEIGGIGDQRDHHDGEQNRRQRIEIE
jgi:2-methylisocitrate lyase-like PEP mutase family enzyme